MINPNKSEEIVEEGEKTEDTGEKETSLEEIDLEDLTDEEYEALPDKVKKLVDAGKVVKSYQADYTRKTQAVAQERKEIKELLEQIKEGQLTKSEAKEEAKTSLRGLDKLIEKAQDPVSKQALQELKKAFQEETEDLLGQKLKPYEQEKVLQLAKKVEGEISEAQKELGSLYEKYEDTIKQELRRFPMASWEEVFRQVADKKDLSKWLVGQQKDEQDKIKKKKEAVTFKEGEVAAEKQAPEGKNLTDTIKSSFESVVQKFPQLFPK